MVLQQLEDVDLIAAIHFERFAQNPAHLKRSREPFSGNGSTTFDSGNFVYDVQFTDVNGFWPVTQVDVPGFPIKRLAIAARATPDSTMT